MADAGTRIPVIGPNIPVYGMYSAIERSKQTDGQFVILQNFRCDSGLPVARNKDIIVLSKPSWATSAVPLGATTCNLNGSAYVVAVFSDGSKGRVAISSSTLDRWIEVTSSVSWTGPSGNNRLTDITDQVSFAIVKTPRYVTSSGVFASRDALLIQNGNDYPRIWDPNTNDQASALTVTAVVNNAGKFQLTVGSHNLVTGDHIWILGIGGLPQLDGIWQITKVSGTQISLDGSTFAAGFTSGGSVYDRADLLVHKPIDVPGTTGSSYATMASFWQVAGTSGKTYASSGVINQGRYNLANSSVAPYANSNAGILWTITNAAAANDIATVQMAVLNISSQVVMLFEGASATAMLSQAKIEVNPDNVAYASISSSWATLYDATSSDVTKNSFVSITQDSTNNRVWIVFDTSQIAGTNAYHLRFTRVGSAPSGTQTTTLLFVGSASGNLPSNTEWSFSFEDEYNKVESRPFVMDANATGINLLGGPAVVTSGSDTKQAPGIPLVDSIVADFKLTVPNAMGTNPITGGLDGQPERINFYVDLPGADGLPTGTFYFAQIATLYTDVYSGGVRAWQKSDTTNTTLTISVTNYDISIINFNREAPSTQQLPIPIANASLFAHNRLFVGGVKDDSSQFGLGDIYFSWERNPFRFQQIQEDDLRGGYIQLGDEEVQVFIASASANLGAGRVFVLSTKNFYSLGDSGPFATSGFSASDLSRPVIIGPHGTLSPLSVAQGYNAIFWMDQDAQIMRLGPDGLNNICRQTVSDRTEMAVASRRSRFSGTFRKDRYYFAYTPAAETENNRVLVWNEMMKAWESEDYETANANFENLMIYSATSSSTTTSRILFFDTAGTMYGYNEDSTGTIAIRFATKDFTYKGWDSWFVHESSVMATANTGVNMTVARVSRQWGPSESWQSTISLTPQSGAGVAKKKDGYIPIKQGSSRGSQEDWAWYLDVSGTVTPGTTIYRFEFLAMGLSSSSPNRL